MSLDFTHLLSKPFELLAFGHADLRKSIPYPDLIWHLEQTEASVVFIGDAVDGIVAERLCLLFPNKAINACGALTEAQYLQLGTHAKHIYTADNDFYSKYKQRAWPMSLWKSNPQTV